VTRTGTDTGRGWRAVNRRTVLKGAVASVGVALLAACGGTAATPALPTRVIPSPSPVSNAPPQGPAMCAVMNGTLAIAGSTALQPLIDAAGKAYQMKCAGVRINVNGGGSGSGLDMAQANTVQIGMSDIFAEEQRSIDPKQLTDFQLVVQGFAVVANSKGTPDSLTQDQLIAIFTGKTQNFRDVGGPDGGAAVVTREKGSGSRATFERYGLGGQVTGGREFTSNGDLATFVAQTPGAIGYVGLATLATNKNLKLVLLDGREPSVENISDNSYPIWSYGHLYTRALPIGMATPQAKTLTQAFLDYLLSDDVQTTLVSQLGYIPVSRVKSRKTP